MENMNKRENEYGFTACCGKNKGHIVLYALSTCPWCRKTKKLLEDLSVEYYFGDVDLMNDADKKGPGSDSKMESERFLPDYGN